MKKQALHLLIFLFLSNFILAQNNLAKLKYEDAEEAFQKNDYQTTLTKLDEVEALLKSSNPKTQYLRILAQEKMVSQGDNINFELLEKLRKNCNTYLIKHESNTSVEDQYKAVYKISERLRSYPATQDDYAKYLEEKKLAEKRKLDRPQLIFDSLCEKYKCRPGMTEEAFKASNPEAAALLITKKQKVPLNDGSYTYMRAYVAGPTSITVKNSIITNYLHTVITGGNETIEKTFEWYKEFLQKNFPAENLKEMKVGDSEFFDCGIKNSRYKISLSKQPIMNSVWLMLIDTQQ